MSKRVTLKAIIESVLKDSNASNLSEEKYNEYENNLEKNTRKLYRKFDRLIERLGGDKEVLKDGGSRIEFDELDAPVIKVLISQLYTGQGVIAEFVKARKDNTQFSSNEVIEFIDTLCDEIVKDDTMKSRNDLAFLVQFFINIFLYSPLRSLETCHAMIDELAVNLNDLPCDEQSLYLGKVEHILKKEVALRFAESKIRILRIVERKALSKEYYYESDPEIQFYYAQRDQQVLKAIQEDEDLRQYIEKKLGRKAEEIFNYAKLK